MSIVCGPSWFGPASSDATAGRSRGPHRVTIEPPPLQQRGTDAAIERTGAARWCDVESVACDGDSQHSGGPLSTVWDGLLATRLHSDAPIYTVAPFAQVTTGRALPILVPTESCGDWGASWVGVGSPARGERPPIHVSVAASAFRGAAPRGGRSPLAGVLMRRLACDVSVADMRTTPVHRRLGVVI